MQHPTVKLYLAAVHSEQIRRGSQDPLKDTPQLSRLLQGLQSTNTRTRLPISPVLLEQITQAFLNNQLMSKHDRYLYATAISIAYFGCLRVGEITYPSAQSFCPKRHLTLDDITIKDNTIVIHLKHSKTDQLGQGATVVIGQSKQHHCPVELARSFLQFRRKAPGQEAVFRRKDGSLLTRQRLQALLRKTISQFGLPAQHFGTHSLRIGAATAAAQAGIPPEHIKALGRWSSDCYRRYMRAPHKTLKNLAKQLCP